jgi:glycosyltransferase involved in cell wall biosynthesis
MQSAVVSVVIPAYNAEATLDETLRSVRSQTHRALEIIIVDDGSTDNTRRIAEQHATLDDRVRVVTQENAGVAAARNNGWQRARSELIAFVDADDLWAPTKIERQLRALQAANEKVGLVYCWFERIDGAAAIIQSPPCGDWEGEVLDKLFLGNFVGNGSSALVRRQALIDAGGFESGLRRAGAEGCEDILFYCRVAERHHFAVVRERLTGYRYLPQNMSSDRPRMLRSWLMMVDEMVARHPQHKARLEHGVRLYGGWLACDAFSFRAYRQSLTIVRLLSRRHPMIGAQVLVDLLRALPMRVSNRLRRVRRSLARARGKGTVAVQPPSSSPPVPLRFQVGDSIDEGLPRGALSRDESKGRQGGIG